MPTARTGAEFGTERIGHYHFAHLEAVRETLFKRVEAYDGPRLDVLRRRRRKVKVALRDVDVRATVRIKPKAALLAEKLRSGFERRLVVEPGARITVRNLDGRRAVVET